MLSTDLDYCAIDTTPGANFIDHPRIALTREGPRVALLSFFKRGQIYLAKSSCIVHQIPV